MTNGPGTQGAHTKGHACLSTLRGAHESGVNWPFNAKLINNLRIYKTDVDKGQT